MALFVIADLHLSIDIDKPMDIFEGWQDYEKKIQNNWKETVSEEDTVVLVGDFCWAKTLREALPSFRFVENLPGKKILLKGNHDYWWTTKSKMDKFFLDNNLSSLSILHNNYYLVDGVCVCGTRGWMFENSSNFNFNKFNKLNPNMTENEVENQDNAKLINREVERLKLSIQGCVQLDLPIFVFLHYPPIYRQQVCYDILDVLKNNGVKKCYYGHLHGEAKQHSVNDVIDGIQYQLISCDYTDFTPIRIA